MSAPQAPGGAPPVRLGDRLIQLGLITQDQLRIALMEQKSSGKPLGEALLALGFTTEEAMRSALADNLGEKAISLKGIVANPRPGADSQGPGQAARAVSGQSGCPHQ
jgi:hypothetical protein